MFNQTNKIKACELFKRKNMEMFFKKTTILGFWVMKIQSTHEHVFHVQKVVNLSGQNSKTWGRLVAWTTSQGFLLMSAGGIYSEYCIGNRLPFPFFFLRYLLDQESYPNSLTKGPRQIFWTFGMPGCLRKNRGMLEMSLKLGICQIILISFKFLETISWWEGTEF